LGNYRATYTAVTNLLDTLECRDSTALCVKAYRSKHVQPHKPKTISEIGLPRIEAHFLGPYPDTSRLREVNYAIQDSSSGETIMRVPYPKPVIFLIQIELVTFNEHDDDQLKHELMFKIGEGYDVYITWEIGGYDITWPCHMHYVSEHNASEWDDNEFEGRHIYTYRLKGWTWPTVDPVSTPLVRQRIMQIDPDGDGNINLEVNFDE